MTSAEPVVGTAAVSADQQADNAPVGTDHVLAEWGPIITAIGAAAANGNTPTELTDLLEDIVTTDWALVTALQRVLAGDRGHELLLAGLDNIGAAILTATLDRLSTSTTRPGPVTTGLSAITVAA